jgi:ATP-dependent Clp protease ATP-binding subunit ClpX
MKKPSALVKYLNQYVIGQDDAKKILAVAVYSHFKKVARSRDEAARFAKSNVLLIGPTGTGKTLMCETLSRALEVPFVTAEASSTGPTATSGRRRTGSSSSTRSTSSRRPTVSPGAFRARACSTRC